MRTLIHFRDFVNEIMESNSRIHKQNILKKYKDDEVIKKYLQINFDPYKVYGISTKKLNKEVEVGSSWCPPTVFDLFDYLEEHNTGRDIDIAVCQCALGWLSGYDMECGALLEQLICKDVNLGVDSKTINKEIPKCLPTFEVMLAHKFFDKPEKLTGKSFAITTKLDGFRLIAMIDENSNVSFYSRVGKRIEGLLEIEYELKTAFPAGTVLDGELTVSNYFEMESKEAYKAASKIITLKGDTPKRGLTYRVFDGMFINEWRSQKCTLTYEERRHLLSSLFYYNPIKLRHIELLPILYQGDDVSKVQELLDEVVSKGGEGVMINILSSTYKFTRCWDIMKVKKFNSLDLEVIGMEEGSGRLTGTLGAIYVRYKGGNTVKVGSGFSDEERKLYFNNPNLILHKIVEIKHFEESSSGEGANKTYSLRFPTWCSNIRIDKLEPDF